MIDRLFRPSGTIPRDKLRSELNERYDNVPPLPLTSDTRTSSEPTKIHWFEFLAWIEQVKGTALYNPPKTPRVVAKEFDHSKKKLRVKIRKNKQTDLSRVSWHSNTHFSTPAKDLGANVAQTVLDIITSLCKTLGCEFQDPDFGPSLSTNGNAICEAYKDFLNSLVPDTAMFVPKVFLNLVDGDSDGIYSLYKTKTPPIGYPPVDMLIWERPQLTKGITDLWYGDGPPSRPMQGNLGDGWFIQALQALTYRPKLLRDIVHTNSLSSKHGVYVCEFYRDSEWHFILVDARLPLWIGSFSPSFARNQDRNENWAGIIEKAYAKLYGQYESLATGSLRRALFELTGASVNTISIPPQLNHPSKELWEDLKSLVSHGAVLVCVQDHQSLVLVDAVSVDHERFVRLTKPRGIQDGVLVNEDQTRLFQKAFLNIHHDPVLDIPLNVEPFSSSKVEETIILPFVDWVQRFSHCYILLQDSKVQFKRLDQLFTDTEVVLERDDQWYKLFEIENMKNFKEKSEIDEKHRLQMHDAFREARRYHLRQLESVVQVQGAPLQPKKTVKRKKKVKDFPPCEERRERLNQLKDRLTSKVQVKRKPSIKRDALVTALSTATLVNELQDVEDATKIKSTQDWKKFDSVIWRGGREIIVRDDQNKGIAKFCLLSLYRSSSLDLLVHLVEPSSGLESYRIINEANLERIACIESKGRKMNKERQNLSNWLVSQDPELIVSVVDLLSGLLRFQIDKDQDRCKQFARLQLSLPRSRKEEVLKEEIEPAIDEEDLCSLVGDECLPPDNDATTELILEEKPSEVPVEPIQSVDSEFGISGSGFSTGAQKPVRPNSSKTKLGKLHRGLKTGRIKDTSVAVKPTGIIPLQGKSPFSL